MKPGTLNRRILRTCRFRSRRFGRIVALLDYLSAVRSDARVARVVALRFRKPRRTMMQVTRAPSRLPWIETRLDQHLHFSIHLHAGAAVRRSIETRIALPNRGKVFVERLRWMAERSRGGAMFRSASSARQTMHAQAYSAAGVQSARAFRTLPRILGASVNAKQSLVPSISGSERTRASLRLRTFFEVSGEAVRRASRTTRITRHAIEIAADVAHTQTITRRYAPARLHLRVAMMKEPAPSAEISARVHHAAARRPVDLTYRKASRDALDAIPMVNERTAQIARSAQATSFVQQPAFQHPAMRTSGALPSRSPTLDAAAVERLAEDVMRRIDKRARIERERRGI